MIIASGVMVFKIHECFSLKEKRSIVKPIIARIQKEFNVSIAEVGTQDKYQLGTIGFSFVGNDRQVLNKKVDKLFNMAESIGLAELIDSEFDIYNF